MRKRVFGHKLSRNRNSRKALFRSLVRSLAIHGSIKTTKAKAKAVQGLIDRVIKKAQSNNLTTRREVYSMLGNYCATTDKLFKEIAPKLNNRASGFTKTIPLPKRAGDNASMVTLEWVEKMTVDDAVLGKKKENKKENKKSAKKEVKIDKKVKKAKK